MKVIDLLVKIANGEESDLTTEFEFDKRIWNFYKFQDSEFCIDEWLLNQEIVITKRKEKIEEKKIPEKLDKRDFLDNETIDQIDADLDFIIDKINEIIDYLKSKGE